MITQLYVCLAVTLGIILQLSLSAAGDDDVLLGNNINERRPSWTLQIPNTRGYTNLYENHDQMSDNTNDEYLGEMSPSKRRWDNEHEVGAFWKRANPSTQHSFWKRFSGVNTFWKRGNPSNQNLFRFRNSLNSWQDQKEGFWKRSEVPSKKSNAQWSLLMFPNYRTFPPELLSSVRAKIGPNWLTTTVEEKAKQLLSQSRSILAPLPPKNRRKGPKANPDFNPTGW